MIERRQSKRTRRGGLLAQIQFSTNPRWCLVYGNGMLSLQTLQNFFSSPLTVVLVPSCLILPRGESDRLRLRCRWQMMISGLGRERGGITGGKKHSSASIELCKLCAGNRGLLLLHCTGRRRKGRKRERERKPSRGEIWVQSKNRHERRGREGRREREVRIGRPPLRPSPS